MFTCVAKKNCLRVYMQIVPMVIIRLSSNACACLYACTCVCGCACMHVCVYLHFHVLMYAHVSICTNSLYVCVSNQKTETYTPTKNNANFHPYLHATQYTYALI